MQRAHVVIVIGPEGVVRAPLDERLELVVGRGRAADVRLAERAVSRRHARISMHGATLWLEDVGSSTGTRLRGELVPRRVPVAFAPGAVIQIGAHVLIVAGGAPAAAAPLPTARLSRQRTLDV